MNVDAAPARPAEIEFVDLPAVRQEWPRRPGRPQWKGQPGDGGQEQQDQ